MVLSDKFDKPMSSPVVTAVGTTFFLWGRDRYDIATARKAASSRKYQIEPSPIISLRRSVLRREIPRPTKSQQGCKRKLHEHV